MDPWKIRNAGGLVNADSYLIGGVPWAPSEAFANTQQFYSDQDSRRRAIDANRTLDLSNQRPLIDAQGVTQDRMYGSASNIGSVADSLRDYRDAGPGPSAAEAQMHAAQTATTNQALSLANSGRGTLGGNSARSLAARANAGTRGAFNVQQDALAALEAQDWRARQAQALSAEAATRNAQAGTYKNIGELATANRAGDLRNVELQLDNQELNDQANLGWEKASVGRETMGYDYRAADAAQRAAYEALRHGQTQTARDIAAQEADRNRAIAAAKRDAYLQAGIGATGVVADALGDK